jgi:hypothetical protein
MLMEPQSATDKSSDPHKMASGAVPSAKPEFLSDIASYLAAEIAPSFLFAVGVGLAFAVWEVILRRRR